MEQAGVQKELPPALFEESRYGSPSGQAGLCTAGVSRIRRIARVIGGDDVTLFSYIDNVLAEHFSANKEVISALYDEHNRPIF